MAMIVDELPKGTPSANSRQSIKAWQERYYAAIIAVPRKIPDKILMWYDQVLTRTGGES